MCIPSKNPGYGPDTIQVQLADCRDYFLENCAALYMRNQLHRLYFTKITENENITVTP